MAEYAYKFALYPSMEQEIKLNKNFGCVRWVYNACLDKRKSYYEETSKTFREIARNSVLDVFYSVDFGVPFVSIVMCLVFFISFFIFSSLTPNSQKNVWVYVYYFLASAYIFCALK